MEIDYRNVEYVGVGRRGGAVNIDYLICPVCKSPFVKPYVTKCGHSFCYECIIETCRITKYCCPLDKVSLGTSEEDLAIVPAPLVLKAISDDLHVRCVTPGCEWVGMRSHLRSHLEREEEKQVKMDSSGEASEEVSENISEEATEASEEVLADDSSVGCRNDEAEPNQTFVCPNQSYGCKWVYRCSIIYTAAIEVKVLATHKEVCKYEKIRGIIDKQGQKIDLLEQNNEELTRKFHLLMNSIPYLNQNSVFVNSLEQQDHLTRQESEFIQYLQLVADNELLAQNMNYMIGNMKAMQVQMNQMSMVYKQQLFNHEMQRMSMYRYGDRDESEESIRVKL